MAKRVRKIRVFIASPSDVKEERERLLKVIDELNRIVGMEKSIFLELVRWETHVAPGMGRPQELINRQVGPFDIFVGIMWKWFGTPTGVADSGTEEEFETAFGFWKVTGRPRILFYFNQAPYTLRTALEADQVRRVLEFRAALHKRGLVWEYNGVDGFERCIREHLSLVVRELTTSSRVRSSSFTQNAAEFSQEPVHVLLASAFSEWKRHEVFASRDRLELFLQNKDVLELSREQLSFILKSWFKTGYYSPEEYVKIYEQNRVIDICSEILNQSKNVDLINGAIKVIASYRTVQSADLILNVIENRNEFHEVNRMTAIGRFWLSDIRGISYDRVPKILIGVLQIDRDYKLRKEVPYCLRFYPSHEVIEALEVSLRDGNGSVRFAAVDALGTIKSPSSIKPLIDLLNRETYSTKMRKKVVWALGRFYDDEEASGILRVIASNDKEDSAVVREAKWGLRPGTATDSGESPPLQVHTI